MATLEPVPGEPAATARLDGERALVIADYHAGIEWALAVERGVEIESRAAQRRELLVDLVARTAPDRLVILGDLMHSIGEPGGSEREEVEALVEALGDLPITLVKGNHDGAIEDWLPGVEVTAGDGARIGAFGFAHGHTWPAPEVLGAEFVCVGHEHPQVRLEDAVGGHRVERVWLRGPMDLAPFAERDPDLPWLETALPPADVEGREDESGDEDQGDGGGADVDDAAAAGRRSDEAPGSDHDGLGSDQDDLGSDQDDLGSDDRDREAAGDGWPDPELVVFPAFNDLAGGTWVNVEGQEFLAPFLPRALTEGEAFLLDGTRLGDYESV